MCDSVSTSNSYFLKVSADAGPERKFYKLELSQATNVKVTVKESHVRRIVSLGENESSKINLRSQSLAVTAKVYASIMVSLGAILQIDKELNYLHAVIIAISRQ